MQTEITDTPIGCVYPNKVKFTDNAINSTNKAIHIYTNKARSIWINIKLTVKAENQIDMAIACIYTNKPENDWIIHNQSYGKKIQKHTWPQHLSLFVRPEHLRLNIKCTFYAED